ncbi:MAG: tRNA (adenosine(37)-N6)-threonylcarbamoyltransferase complex ATPase subunit type 1 TsaE [Pelotomaculum sp.]
MKRLFSVITHSPEETARLGMVLGALLRAGDMICLEGDLGAGKTCFAQGVARGMGIEGPVSSPTFTLVNEYYGELILYHLDVYRLNSSDELEDLGYEEIFYGDGVTLLEWAERVQEALPAERLEVRIKRQPDEEAARVIEISSRGERYGLLVEELKSIVRSGD